MTSRLDKSETPARNDVLMAMPARPDTPPRPNPAAFGLCSGTIGAATAALVVLGGASLVAASDPPGTLEPGPGFGTLSTLLIVALFIGGLVGLLCGLVLADQRPERAERLAPAVYALTSVALLIVLGTVFLLYFMAA
jgi:hypothetical protein